MTDVTAGQQPAEIRFDEHFSGLDDGVEHLRQMILARQEAERCVAAAEQAVLAMVDGAVRVGGTLEDPVMKNVLRRLHYRIRFFPSAALARTLGFINKNGVANVQAMARQLGPAAAEEPCTACGKTILTYSGSGATDDLCPKCRKAVKDEYFQQAAARWEPRNSRHEHIQRGTVTALVADWRVAAALVLAYPPATTERDHPDTGWTWAQYEHARATERHLATLLPEDCADLPMDTAAPLLAAAQVAADWHPGRACSITEHLTERSPTAILTQLKTAVTRRRRELEAEALVLHPDLPDPADTRPTGALLVADGTERQS